MPKRDEFVRVRLVPSHLGHATQVKLAGAEKEALQAAALAKGYPELSTFLRELGVAAAVAYHQKTVGEVAGAFFKQEVIARAAADAHMLAGEWMRVVALAVIGFSKLDGHIEAGRKAYDAGLPKDEG